MPPIDVDTAQMKQVFLNLFLNALDSMENAGYITVSTSLGNSGKASITIKDTGKGINKDDLRHIFDPFFSRKDGGTGLGLSVVHGIVKKHGGKIDVESIPGAGTSFTVSLPVG